VRDENTYKEVISSHINRVCGLDQTVSMSASYARSHRRLINCMNWRHIDADYSRGTKTPIKR
jgi:hypothetical protein